MTQFIQDPYDLSQIEDFGEVNMQVGVSNEMVHLILDVRGKFMNLPIDPEMAFKVGNALIMASRTQGRLKLVEANG